MGKQDKTGNREMDDAVKAREKKEQAGNQYAVGNKSAKRRNVATGLRLGTGRRVKPTK